MSAIEDRIRETSRYLGSNEGESVKEYMDIFSRELEAVLEELTERRIDTSEKGQAVSYVDLKDIESVIARHAGKDKKAES